MKILQYILVFSLVILCSCQRSSKFDEEESGRGLLQQAKDKQYSIDTRLRFTSQADSVASRRDDKQLHLDCILITGALNLQKGKIDTAWSLFIRSAMLSKKLSDMEGLAVSLSSIGSIYQFWGKYDSAIQYFVDAQAIFDSLGEPKKIAQNMVNTGITYESQGNFAEAFKVDIRAAAILDSLHDTDDFASVCINIGNVLRELKQFEDALRYQMQALSILMKQNDSAGMALVWNNIGNTYRDKKDFKEALANYIVALNIKQQYNDPREIAITLDNIGQVYVELAEFGKAQQHFEKAINLEVASQDTNSLIETYNSLGKLYLRMGNLPNALKTAETVFKLGMVNSSLKQRLTNNMILFETYSKLGKNIAAVTHAKKSFELKDSLLSEQIAKEISLLNTQFKVRQKEEEILFHKKIEHTQKSQINIQYVAIVLLVFLLFSITGTAFLLRQSNKKIKQANRRIETLHNELNHRVKNNLQLISDLLYLQKDTATDQNQTMLIDANISRVEAMNIVHSLLYKKEFNGVINMKRFIVDLTENLAKSHHNTSALFKNILHVDSNLLLDVNKAIPIGLIINELMTNIYKHSIACDNSPVLEISFTEEENICKLEIRDTCLSWDVEKGKAKKSGLGLFLVKTLIEQLDGTWNTICNDKGNKHQIMFSKY